MHRLATVLMVSALAGAQECRAQEIRYYEDNGTTLKETVHTVERPVVQTEWQTREQTVYRPQLRTEMRETLRTYSMPVTHHEWITRMHGRWNPFTTPYFTHHLVPVTRWERRAELIKLPVVKREWVREKRTVSVPLTSLRVAQEKVIRRTPVAGAPATAPSPRVSLRSSAINQAAFGTALDGDPPRHGLRWQRPDVVLR
jgi:hypothetical protein